MRSYEHNNREREEGRELFTIEDSITFLAVRLFGSRTKLVVPLPTKQWWTGHITGLGEEGGWIHGSAGNCSDSTPGPYRGELECRSSILRFYEMQGFVSECER